MDLEVEIDSFNISSALDECAFYLQEDSSHTKIAAIMLTMGFVGLLLNSSMAWLVAGTCDLRRSNHAVLALQLFIAGLFVAAFSSLFDGFWNLAMFWFAGNFMCKALKYLQMLGHYASGFLVILMTFERCLVVTFPVCSNSGAKATSLAICVMSVFVWIAAAIFSIPQAIVFHVMTIPGCPKIHQCVTHGSYANPLMEILYSLFRVIAFFVVPLFLFWSCILFLAGGWCVRSLSKMHRRQGAPDFGRPDVNLWKTHRKSVLKTFLMAAAYLLMWAPLSVTEGVAHFYNGGDIHYNILLHIFAILGFSSNLMLPIIFGFFHCCGRVRHKSRSSPDGCSQNLLLETVSPQIPST